MNLGHITIVPAFGMLLAMFLCGRMKLPFINTSSFIYTSSASTLTPSIRTHRPTIDFQPIIDCLMKASDLIWLQLRRQESCILAPFCTTHFSPMVTFGPMRASGCTFAVGWINTLPMMLPCVDPPSCWPLLSDSPLASILRFS